MTPSPSPTPTPFTLLMELLIKYNSQQTYHTVDAASKFEYTSGAARVVCAPGKVLKVTNGNHPPFLWFDVAAKQMVLDLDNVPHVDTAAQKRKREAAEKEAPNDEPKKKKARTEEPKKPKEKKPEEPKEPKEKKKRAPLTAEQKAERAAKREANKAAKEAKAAKEGKAVESESE
jgi:outer membrane biosynthesis protein TonB